MDELINVHPGDALAEFLEDYNLSKARLAKELRVPASRINAIIKGNRPVTADMAIRLSKFFGNSVEFWLGLQELYDIAKAREELGGELEKIHTLAFA